MGEVVRVTTPGANGELEPFSLLVSGPPEIRTFAASPYASPAARLPQVLGRSASSATPLAMRARSAKEARPYGGVGAYE